MPLDILENNMINKISVYDILYVIDRNQTIIIQRGSDILYRGKCCFLVPIYEFQNIYVLNILFGTCEDNSMIICVDKYFE